MLFVNSAMVKIKGYWFPTERPQLLVVVGHLRSMAQHYIQEFRYSAGCQAPLQCELCKQKRPVQTIHSVPVKLPDAEEIYLLRIYPNQQHLLSLLSSGGRDLIGKVVQVEKAPGAIRLRSLIQITNKRVPASPAPVDNYYRSLGKATYQRMIIDLESQTALDV